MIRECFEDFSTSRQDGLILFMNQNIQVLFEDNHLLAINKPAGWLVQGDATGDQTLADWAKAYIKARYHKPGDVFLGIIHRLDRPVSGVVVFARTSKALERMNQLFRDRLVEKTYWAITDNRPKDLSGTLVHYIWKDEGKNLAHVIDRPSRRHPDAKKSELHYEVIGNLNNHTLLKVNPVTGRGHQIRVQLASMGCPIVGDVKYGFKHANPDASIHLHCFSLAFEHPVKKEKIVISVEPPREQKWNWFL